MENRRMADDKRRLILLTINGGISFNKVVKNILAALNYTLNITAMFSPAIKRYKNVSFSGCGFLGMYHIGVASCLKTYAPYLLTNKLCGSSAGAITACCLLCDVPLELVASNTLEIIKKVRSNAFGPFSPTMNITEHMYTSFKKDLPDDVHKRVNGKLFVSLTRLPDGKNVVISEFCSKEDVMQVLLASSFIPVFSGFKPPLIGKYRYMDGGFTDNLPVIDEDEDTITISPFSGLTDISPCDNNIQKYLMKISNHSIELTKSNCFRVARIMFPPEPQMLAKLCNEGFNDALDFLQKNNLIICNTCLLQQDISTSSENNIDKIPGYRYNSSCIECKWNNAYAKVQGMPYSITYTLDRYIDSHGRFNGILISKGVQFIKLFTSPYIVVADLAYDFIIKVICHSAHFQQSMWTLSKYVINSLLHLVDIFSKNGLEFVSKVLYHSSMKIENHGRDSPYYYYYNESCEEIKSIKCSKMGVEYFNDYHQYSSAIAIDAIGYTSTALNLNTHQAKSVKSTKHSTVHWMLSINPEFILSSINESVTNETTKIITKVGTVEDIDKFKNALHPVNESFDNLIEVTSYGS